MTTGMYLQLFHGRKSPEEDMDNWGSNGPIFGPLESVHTTYASMIWLNSLKVERGGIYVTESLAYYDGVYYGDWSVFYLNPDETTASEMESLKKRHTEFREDLAELPKKQPTGEGVKIWPPVFHPGREGNEAGDCPIGSHWFQMIRCSDGRYVSGYGETEALACVEAHRKWSKAEQEIVSSPKHQIALILTRSTDRIYGDDQERLLRLLCQLALE